MKQQGPVIPAPQWLKDRMDWLRKRPAPSSEQVEIQFRAAEAGRMKYDDKPPRFANGQSAPVES